MASFPNDTKVEEQLRAEVDAFLEEYLPKENAEVKHNFKVVHDGVWGTLRLNPREVCLLDTPLLQRLRQIHQTGCAYFIYPSTQHTRFEHTLGVMTKLQQLIDALLKNCKGSGENRLDERQVEEMRIAALLHDVGHGPFSHTSEEVYGITSQVHSLRNKYPGSKPHELLAYFIITSEKFRESCAVLDDTHKHAKLDIDNVAASIAGQSTGPAFIRELLNGPFDADKLDYLFRDSLFSGIPLSVDLERLWYTVRIAKAGGDDRLVVTQSGATSLEQIFFSRMVLFASVYHHHKIRACDCMFAGIVEYMRANSKTIPLKGKTITWDSPIDFLWLTDNELLSFGFRTDDKDLHNLIHNLYFRRLLKRAVIISRRTIEDSGDDRIDRLLEHAKLKPESTQFKRDVAMEIWSRARKPCLPQEIWLDLPEQPSMQASWETFVLPSDEAQPVPLNNLFPADKWTGLFVQNKWRGHVFCPPQHVDAVAKAARDVFAEKFDMKLKPEAFSWCKVKVPK